MTEDRARFGGELPAGADRLLPYPIEEDGLLFSHGRAALTWLMARQGAFSRCLMCAYTCASVPEGMEAAGMSLAYFDVGAGEDEIVALAAGAGRTLVLVPALFGLAPWLDASSLARRLGTAAVVVIDGAQTAFGHRDYPLPPGGAILSCPRKTVAVPDGAVLRVDGLTNAERQAVRVMPEAAQSVALKTEARRLFATRDPVNEPRALSLARAAEDALPVVPHRMSDAAREYFLRVDGSAHAAVRRGNRRRLMARLEGRLPLAFDGDGTPFGHAVLYSGDRDAFLRRLHARRVFATALWPDARHDSSRHPRAARMVKELVSLPIDQRYTGADMDLLADLVLASM